MKLTGYDRHGIRHSWLTLGMGIGLSVIGFMTAFIPSHRIALQVDEGTYFWEPESPVAGRLLLDKNIGLIPGEPPHSGLVAFMSPEAAGRALPALSPYFQCGNVITEVAIGERGPHWLFQTVNRKSGTDLAKEALKGLIGDRQPVRIAITKTGAVDHLPAIGRAWIATAKLKITHDNQSVTEGYIAAAHQENGIKVVDALPFSRPLTASRGSYHYREIKYLEATAYYPGPECTGKTDGITFSGKKAGYGIVAVDPEVIPLGTRLYVEGYGYAEAADIGGAIQGSKIDLCFETYQEAINYGRKKITVYILE